MAFDIGYAVLSDVQEYGKLRDGTIPFEMEPQVHGYRVRGFRDGPGNEKYYRAVDDGHIPRPTIPQYAVMVDEFFLEIQKPPYVAVFDVVVIGRMDQAPPPSPIGDDEENETAENERDESPFPEFDAVRDEESQIQNQEGSEYRGGDPWLPFPVVYGDREHRNRSDAHDAGNRETVRGRQPGRGSEPDDQRNASDEQDEIHERDIDLPLRHGIGMDDAYRREKF